MVGFEPEDSSEAADASAALLAMCKKMLAAAGGSGPVGPLPAPGSAPALRQRRRRFLLGERPSNALRSTLGPGPRATVRSIPALTHRACSGSLPRVVGHDTGKFGCN